MRSFIAIPIPEDVQNQLQTRIDEIKKLPWAKSINWYPPQNYHVTLQFLGGHLNPEKVQAVQNTMHEWFSEGMSHFEAELRTIHPFPSHTKPHTLAILLEKTILLQYLVREIENHIKPLGFTPSKQSFRPHISLGHIPKSLEPSSINLPEHLSMIENCWLTVDKITLFESQLNPNAPPSYRPLHSCLLEYY